MKEVKIAAVLLDLYSILLGSYSILLDAYSMNSMKIVLLDCSLVSFGLNYPNGPNLIFFLVFQSFQASLSFPLQLKPFLMSFNETNFVSDHEVIDMKNQIYNSYSLSIFDNNSLKLNHHKIYFTYSCYSRNIIIYLTGHSIMLAKHS